MYSVHLCNPDGNAVCVETTFAPATAVKRLGLRPPYRHYVCRALPPQPGSERWCWYLSLHNWADDLIIELGAPL